MTNSRYQFIKIGMLAASFTSLPVLAQEPLDEAALTAEAAGIVKQFGGTLKPLLKEAIETGGLKHAIDICSTQAPQIAAQLSKASGWSVKRVSLKPRNTLQASADAFETDVLRQFDLRQQAGEQPNTISYTQTTDVGFRFMKAQGVEGLCLNCHGQAIQKDVESALQQYYPNDVAMGYSIGQIRGAFSLTKSVNNDQPEQQ